MILYSKNDACKAIYSFPSSNLLTQIQRNLHIYLTKTYNVTPKIFKQHITFQLLHNSPTHLVSIFKEHMINDYVEEFLKREYALHESTDRLPKFARFYKNYLQFFCKATLRHFTLNEMIKSYGEEKAENYYKENYPDNNEDNKDINNDERSSRHIHIHHHENDSLKCDEDDSDSDEDDFINSKSTIFSNSVNREINNEDVNESFFSDIHKAMQFPLSQRYLKTFERINIETFNGKLWKPNLNNITKHSSNNTIINLLNNLKLKRKSLNSNNVKRKVNGVQICSQKMTKKKGSIKQQGVNKNGGEWNNCVDKHKNAMSYTNLKNLIKYNTLFESTLRNGRNNKQIESFKKIIQKPQPLKGEHLKMKVNNNSNNNITKNGEYLSNHVNKSRNKMIDSNIGNNTNTHSLNKKKLMNYTFRTLNYYLHSPKTTNKITLIKPSHKAKQRHKLSNSPNHNNNAITHIHPIVSFSNNITNRKTRTESSLSKNYLPLKIAPHVKPLSSIRKNIPYGTRTIISSPKSVKSNSNSSRNITTDRTNLMKIALSVLFDGHKNKNNQHSKTTSLNINIKNSINMHNHINNNKSRNSNRSNIGLESFLKSNYNHQVHNKSVSNFVVKKNINLKKKGYDIRKVLPKSKEYKK